MVTLEFLSLLRLLVVDQRVFLLLLLFKRIKGVEVSTRQHQLCCPLPCRIGTSWVGLVNEPKNRFCSNSLCCLLGLSCGGVVLVWFCSLRVVLAG